MKKVLLTAAVMAMVAGGASMVMAAGNDGTGIVGSSHDFSDNVLLAAKTGATVIDESWNTRQEICRVCHAPHDKNRTRYEDGLLWNHAVSDLTFTMYSSETLDGAVDAQPTGSTKLCMGCHDGATAINTFDSLSGTINITAYNNTSINMGASTGHLDGNHPVSVVYDNTADLELNDPAVATFDDGNTVAKVLQEGKVQCSSCHDVHNKNTAPGSSLLRTGNTLLVSKGGGPNKASALCLTCHNK